MAVDLYDSVSATALTRATVWRDSDTNAPIIRHIQNVGPILEANKQDANAYQPRALPMGLRHIARLPVTVVMQLQHEGLLDYKGRVGDERKLMRFLSDPDNMYLRVDNGRRLA